MLGKWLDKLRRKSQGGTGPLDPKVAARAGKQLVTIERPLMVAIASADPERRHVGQDVLESLAPIVRVARLEDAEALGAELQLRALDLVVVDLGLAGGASGGEGLLDLIAHTRPRVAVVALADDQVPDGVRRAAGQVPELGAIVDVAGASFPAQLAKAAAAALGRHERERLAAHDALAAAVERARTHPASGARALVEVARTGLVGGAERDALRQALGDLAAALPEAARERADVLAVLAADAFERHDEIGLVYHATLLAEAAPERQAEAEGWLARREELGTALYAAIDRRLEHVMVLRRIGRYGQVLKECEAIHAALGNILPAHHLEAEALRHEGELEAAIACYDRIAELSLQNGEVDRARQALSYLETLDTTGAAAPRVRATREQIARIEEALADPAALPRYPCLRVCERVMCLEAAEASQGFFVVDPHGECDVCDTGVLGRLDALGGTTIAVIGGRLGRWYKDGLRDMGVRRVLTHDAITEPAQVPALVAQADAVVLVTGAGTHWGILKAERELARAAKPAVRVHFYGVRQVARAVALDLAPRLSTLRTPS